MPNSPSLYVIAGPNGAGKTTFARTFLPHFANCREFVNADYIATGLSPFAPTTAAIEAGRLMLKRMREISSHRRSFAIETTLSGKGYLRLFRRLKTSGYHIHLFYLWLPSVLLAIQRVRDRVRQGGHSVPEADIRRRFDRGLKNVFGSYRRVWDSWTLIDNSAAMPRLIALTLHDDLRIIDRPLYQKIKGDFGGCMKTKRKRRLPPLALKAEKAMKMAVSEVRREHRRRGEPLVVWKNGKVAKIPA